MIAWLVRILWGNWCQHEWETIKEETLRYSTEFSSGVCDQYTLKCKKCGNFKFVRSW